MLLTNISSLMIIKRPKGLGI